MKPEGLAAAVNIGLVVDFQALLSCKRILQSPQLLLTNAGRENTHMKVWMKCATKKMHF